MSGAKTEPLWVAPEQIRFKISPHHDLNGIAGGDWDVLRRFPLAEAVKHRAIWERYSQGIHWEDTELFKVNYRRRFEAGDTVRGEATFDDLLRQYYTRVDGLFAAMKRDGFQLGHALPVLLIGRDQVFIGNQGNHRLAMSQVLGLKRFAGKVLCRHPLSQP